MVKLLNKNLYSAQRFFQDCFGAICFYNEPQDGYLTFDDGREMETLAIYFPNLLDIEDIDLSSRLRKVAGENFFDSYIGAKGLRLCGINGCKILASYTVNGKVVAVKTYGAAGLKGNIHRVMDYLCGYDLGSLDRVTNDIATNNGNTIKRGMLIKDITEIFLTENCLPNVTKENGYYISPHEEINISNSPRTIRKPDSFVARDIIRQYFPESNVADVATKRQKDFEKLFNKLSKEEWYAYLRDMQVPVFDRIIDKKEYP